jgi:[ribosomal protein S18]-alanine N-acetyltransferase
MDPTFRALQTADVDLLFTILKPIYSQPQFPLGGAWTARLLETELDQGVGLGLFEGGSLSAFVLYRRQADIWDIVLLGTRVERQRQGLMDRLLSHLLLVRPAGTEVWLEVHQGNVGAQNLYKKLGFRQVGRRPKYYRDGSDAILFNFR